MNALKALGVDTAAYQTLTVMGLREALPSALRLKLLRVQQDEDFSEEGLNKLFTFQKDEVNALRKSWYMAQGKVHPQRKGTENSFTERGKQERPQERTDFFIVRR